MGLALIIPNISFADNNLGQVQMATDAALTSVNIVPTNGTVFNGTSINDWCQIVYNVGVAANKKGVTYSLQSTTYASINASTGEITIKLNANNSKITVIVTSIYNNKLSAQIDLTVTFKDTGVIDLSKSIMFVNGKRIEAPLQYGGCVYLEGELTFPATNDRNIKPMAFDAGAGCIMISKETYYNNNENLLQFSEEAYERDNYRITLQQANIFSDHVIFSKNHGVIVDGDVIAATPNTTGEQWQYPVGRGDNRAVFNKYDGSLNTGSDITQSALDAYINNIHTTYGIPSDYVFKLKKFIVFKTSDYGTKEEIIENRANAIIDMQFDEDGVPYNAGKDKTYKFVVSVITE